MRARVGKEERRELWLCGIYDMSIDFVFASVRARSCHSCRNSKGAAGALKSYRHECEGSEHAWLSSQRQDIREHMYVRSYVQANVAASRAADNRADKRDARMHIIMASKAKSSNPWPLLTLSMYVRMLWILLVHMGDRASPPGKLFLLSF